METSRECVETWRNVEFQSEQSGGGVSPPSPGLSGSPLCRKTRLPRAMRLQAWMLLSRQAVNSYTFPAEGDLSRPSGLQLRQDRPLAPHRGTQSQMPFPI